MRSHLSGKNAPTLIKARANSAGTSHVVNTLNDAGSGSLREAAASAVAGDQITFAQGLAGTIALASDLPELNAVTIANAAGITLSRTGADTLARGLAIKADTTISGALPGAVISASTADGAYVKGISCLGDLTLGDFAGSVSATATGSDTEAAGIELPNLLTIGNITGSVTAANSHGPANSIGAYGGLSAGNIPGTIRATADASDACGLYSETLITLRELSGAVTVTAGGDGYGLLAESCPLSMGALSGTVSVTAGGNAIGACGATLSLGDMTGEVTVVGNGCTGLASEGTLGMGALSGSIKATGAGANCGVLSIGNLSMSGLAASGSITSVSSDDVVMGLFCFGALTMGGALAGTITTTGAAEAFGCHCAGALTLDAFSGSIATRGGGLSIALAGGGGMNINISGTLSGVDTSGEGEGYALRSGYWDGSDWVAGEVGNTVVLLDGARLTGKVDLAGGDNTLAFVGSDVVLDGSVTCSSSGSSVLIVQAAAVIASAITNFTTFQKLGDGILDLQADLNLVPAGHATVSEGELRLAAGLSAASTEIEGAATFSGSGTVTGSLANAGVLAPTALAVNGSLTLTADGTLRLAVSDAGFSSVSVTGAAALDGVLEIDVDAGFTAAGVSMAILTATGGFSGDFASVSVVGGAWQATLVHEAGRVTLTLNT